MLVALSKIVLMFDILNTSCLFHLDDVPQLPLVQWIANLYL